jgi:hypothetical protein
MVFELSSKGLKRPDEAAHAQSRRCASSGLTAVLVGEAGGAFGPSSVIQPQACKLLMQNKFRKNPLLRIACIVQLIRQNVADTSRYSLHIRRRLVGADFSKKPLIHRYRLRSSR